MSESLERLKDLMLCIADKSRNDTFFGATKLNKLLYYIDFEAHRRWGESITGATYYKLQAGPAPRQLLQARRELFDEGLAAPKEQLVFGNTQQRLVPVASYDDLVTQRERMRFCDLQEKLIDEVISFFWQFNALQISEYSHHEPGWQLADLKENIPYHTAWLPREPQPAEVEMHFEGWREGGTDDA